VNRMRLTGIKKEADSTGKVMHMLCERAVGDL